jgi:hypothetical protein
MVTAAIGLPLGAIARRRRLAVIPASDCVATSGGGGAVRIQLNYARLYGGLKVRATREAFDRHWQRAFIGSRVPRLRSVHMESEDHL